MQPKKAERLVARHTLRALADRFPDLERKERELEPGEESEPDFYDGV